MEESPAPRMATESGSIIRLVAIKLVVLSNCLGSEVPTDPRNRATRGKWR